MTEIIKVPEKEFMLIKMTTFDKVIFLTSLLSIGYQDENEIG